MPARPFIVALGAASFLVLSSINPFVSRLSAQTAAAVPYENMPEMAPPGVRIGKYLDVPEDAKGPAIDPDAFIWDQCSAMESSLRHD